MTVRAILHEPTRVIRTLTTDDSRRLEADEIDALVGDDFDLKDGPWKLDRAGNAVRATAEETKIAFAQPVPLIVLAARTAIVQAIADALVPTTVKQVFRALDALIAPEA